MSISDSLSDYYGDDWKNIVVSGELGRLKEIIQSAKKDIDERVKEFLEIRKQALSEGSRTFIYRDREYKITKNVKDNYINYQRTKGLEQRKSLYAYRYAEANSWIYKTLLEKKKLSLFSECNRLVMIGCGLYPYSMFDIFKKYKHITQIGLEINQTRYKVAKSLVSSSPAKNNIKIIHMDGNDFDYSKLSDEDLIFISCDVDSNSIVKKVLETSKAHVFICAPYHKEWMKDSIKKDKLVFDQEDGITSLHT